jgi:hypothetical protein
MPLLDGRGLTQALVAFAIIGLLGLVLRWTFGRELRNPQAPTPPHDPDDFGLLAPVAVVESLDEADRVRGVLAGAGIRATVNVADDGHIRVLVFASELTRARRALPSA